MHFFYMSGHVIITFFDVILTCHIYSYVNCRLYHSYTFTMLLLYNFNGHLLLLLPITSLTTKEIYNKIVVTITYILCLSYTFIYT